MSKLVLLILGISLLLVSAVSAQDLQLDPLQPVNAQITADTLANGTQAHTRYLVASNTYYAFDGALDVDFDLVIEGPDNGWILNDATPPIFFQTPASDGSARDMINLNQGGSATLKNILLTGLHPNDVNISSFVRNFAGYKMVFDNCVFTDHRYHVTRSTGATDEITITNCVFINADRRAYSPFGGMPYRLDAACAALTFENNTVVNSGRLHGNGGNFFTSVQHEIHNSFLNQQVNAHETHWFEGIQANNIFYNWSFRGRKDDTNGYEAHFTPWDYFADVEFKLDSIALYHGRNLMYLEPTITDFFTNSLADSVMPCFLWSSEIDSTIEADNNFTIGKNYGFVDPGFTSHPGNTQAMMDWVFANWNPDLRPTDTPDWRVTPPVTWSSTGQPTLNWPPAWDLSYSNAALLTAGTDGLPLGDLNWFPSAKATYMANRATYIAALRDSMVNATSLYIPGDTMSALITPSVGIYDNQPAVPGEFRMSQNYPNPFNPSTTIEYSIGKPGLVTIELYNTLGQKVATLVNGNKSIGNYEVTLDASSLTSGIYFYTITAGEFSQTKKMLLLK